MSLRLKHVGIVVEDIPAAISVFAALGYKAVGAVVHDPVQTAFVQFLGLGGDATLLELVCPDGPASKVARAASKGGGLNHLCYETDDIEATLASMHERGLFVLAKPTPAPAFEGRPIAWLMGRNGIPVEVVQAGDRLATCEEK